MSLFLVPNGYCGGAQAVVDLALQYARLKKGKTSLFGSDYFAWQKK